jgi:hypothetical protein
MTTAKIAAAMGGARKFTLVLVAALCAALLAACGGDDDSTSTTGTEATGAGSAVADGGGAAGQAGGGKGDDDSKAAGGKDGQGGKDGTGSSDDSDGDGGGHGGDGGSGSGGGSVGGSADIDFTGPPTRHDHPEPVDGERSDAFRSPGGDNSIQEYGEEEDAEERAEAMKPIVALYRALESGDWTTVCSTYLSRPNLEQIEMLAEKSPQIKGAGCAEILGNLNQTTGLTGPDTPDGEIVSFRTEGDTGFAIWWGIDGKGYAMPLKSEEGGWKLTALAPTPLHFGT